MKLAGFTVTEILSSFEDTVIARAICPLGNKVMIRYRNDPQPNDIHHARWHQEFSLLQTLSSPFIIGAHEIVPDEYGHILVLEQFSGQTLSSVIKDNELSLNRRLRFACLLIEALTDLHFAGFIHRNLTPENILINVDSFELKLSDLSMTSSLKHQCMPADKQQFSLNYAYYSPELISRASSPIDHRSDFYSLGIILYELISGQKPFDCDDFNTVIQAHISKTPEPLDTVDSKIPQEVSAIVQKLLEKQPDNRYQNHRGLLSDMKNCHKQWQTKGQIDHFDIAQVDIPNLFTLSGQVYGRSIEQTGILAAFERASAGMAELILISGPAGVGKSTLVQQLHQVIINKRGFFVHGHCDQYHSNHPYGALIEAFSGFLNRLLLEGEERLRYWRGKLKTALGKNTAVIAEMLPSLVKLLGEIPDLPELPPNETEKRFHLTFGHFIKALSSSGHPLVIFIDNMQWADKATLRLLAHQTIANEKNSVLMIGSYRDEEVDADHPLLQTIENIELAQGRIKSIHLNNLARHNVHQLIIDSFVCSPTDVRTMADECYEKTAGNPFYVKQYLNHLHETGTIYFDSKSNKWLSSYMDQGQGAFIPISQHYTGDLAEDENPLHATQNIVALLTQRLHRLDWESQHLLAIAAHLGSSFTLNQLSIVAEKDLDKTSAAIFPALQAEFILALDENYKFTHSDSLRGRCRYCFNHDLIQQAAYRLISDKDRAALRLNIARLMHKNTPTEEIENHIYRLLEQYNRGRQLINDPQEKARLLAFNIHAGIKAKNASAFDAAVEYLRIAKSLTVADAWEFFPNQTLTVYKELSESEYLAGNYSKAETIYRQGIDCSQDLLSKITMYLVQCEQYQLQGRHQQAIETLKLGLTLLDCEISDDEAKSAQQLQDMIQEVEGLLVNIEAAELLAMPYMTKLEQIMAMQLYFNLLHSLNACHKSNTYGLVSCRMVILMLKHGQSDLSPIALSHYMQAIATLTANQQRSYQIGKLSLELADHCGNKYFRSTCYQMFASSFLHWCEPIQNSINYLRQVITWGHEGINLSSACEAALWLFITKSVKGTHLPTLEEAVRSGLHFTRRSGNKKAENNIIISTLQPLLALQNKTFNPLLFDNERINVQRLLAEDKGSSSKTKALYNYSMLRHAYIMRDRITQQSILEQTELVEHHFAKSPLATDFTFYTALSILANTIPGKPNYVDNIKKVKELAALVKTWANQSPRNYEHKYLIINAELAKVCGDIPTATTLFDKAIEASEQAGFIHCEALANELFATCWANENQSRVAKTFIREAHHLYHRWGATAKCQAIEEQWSNVSFKYNDKELVDFASTKSDNEAMREIPPTPLDVRALLKANQTLAQEIHIEPLLRKMLIIMLEQAGAQYGAIIFDEDSRLMVQAIAKLNPLEGKIHCEIIDTSLAEACAEAPPKLPSSVIRYVQQTQETLVVDNPLQDQRFSHNDYLQNRDPAATLLLPIVHQHKLKAIVYLETNVHNSSFNLGQIETLEQLSNQAAISLSNAQLFENLNEKNRKRKEQLKRAKDKADRANETKSLFLANMSHEIRTPLTTVIGFAEGILFGDIESKNHQQAIQTIANSGKHLLLLINDILDFSKIEAGQLLVEKLDVNLVELLTNLESISLGMAKPKSISFDIDLKLPLPDIISTDPTRLNQILLNLISNAVKFTEKGGVTLQIYSQDQQLCFKVIDTGVGIKEDKISSLFFAFEQADKTVQRKYGGTGLGLTISKSLAQMLGGDIVATSEFGVGSTFTVSIELVTVEQSQSIESLETLQQCRDALEGAKAQPISTLEGSILVAEDQPENLQLIMTMLEKMGLEVTGVSNGQEAIEEYLVNDFDLILLDIQMPVMDGLETFDMLTSLSNDTPVIALTANAMKHEVQEYFRKGFDEHLSKPIERKPFIEKISHFLGQSPTNIDASLSEDEMRELQDQFSANLPAYLDRLTEHLRTQDWCSLQADAHALKGAAGTLGFTQLSELAAHIEQELKADIIEPIEQDVANLVEHASAHLS